MTLTCCQDHILSSQKIYGLYGLKHHIVEIREDINRKTLPEFTFIQISPLVPLGQKLAITTSFLRRTLSVVGVRAQAKLLLGRLEVIGPGAGAAAGRRNYSLNLERIWANQRRADQLSRLQGKSLLRRGHFKID